jgi:hypothetical protein
MRNKTLCNMISRDTRPSYLPEVQELLSKFDPQTGEPLRTKRFREKLQMDYQRRRLLRLLVASASSKPLLGSHLNG